eukprot:CAMPEP_0168259050 /NCGR_PEP_ID=MMETSP0141_2-20121125/7506_1 /TAXON_ID=44445 /ORGANISM="Pseudo-nitzschia australis, Strain 10249 10 AB" /LENGTH=89 /DNA_ID=CAMNT_0008196441 /DNA_START=33 /DNA_END=298 /DNA_ORIENTATION=-
MSDADHVGRRLCQQQQRLMSTYLLSILCLLPAATNSGTAGASYSYSPHNPTGENGTAGLEFESSSKKSESASSSKHQAAGGVSYSTQHP